MVPAARTLQRRFRARDLYRVRRDRKIASDWLGRDFILSWRNQLGEEESVRLTIVGYDPTVHMVRLLGHRTDVNIEFTIAWTTDEFWGALREGRLVNA